MKPYTPELRKFATREEALAYARGHGQPGNTEGVREPDGLMRHTYFDRTGREITEFSGDMSCWMDQFKRPLNLMVKINKNPNPKLAGYVPQGNGGV